MSGGWAATERNDAATFPHFGQVADSSGVMRWPSWDGSRAGRESETSEIYWRRLARVYWENHHRAKTPDDRTSSEWASAAVRRNRGGRFESQGRSGRQFRRFGRENTASASEGVSQPGNRRLGVLRVCN